MGDFKFKLTGVVLVFVTISLLFNMDFTTQVSFVFDKMDIDVEELTEKQMQKVLSHTIEENFPSGFYTYLQPTTIENKISTEKYDKLTNIINLEKDYSAIVIRAYEADEYVTARYYISLNGEETLDSIISDYQEKLINSGYEEKDGKYLKDGIEISFLNKWDCITLIVKGL